MCEDRPPLSSFERPVSMTSFGLSARAASLGRGAALAVWPAIAVPTRSYHKNIVDHYESPRNVGSMDKSDPSVGTGLVGAPACGDVMKLQIRVDQDGVVEEAVFKAPPPPPQKARHMAI